MGDRVYLKITMRQKDYDAHKDLCESWGLEPELFRGALVELVDEEANWGGGDARDGLAAEGIPYFGYHYAGDDYAAAVFCAIDGRQYEADAIDSGGVELAVVLNQETGEPLPGSAATAASYVEARRKVMELFYPHRKTRSAGERATGPVRKFRKTEAARGAG